MKQYILFLLRHKWIVFKALCKAKQYKLAFKQFTQWSLLFANFKSFKIEWHKWAPNGDDVPAYIRGVPNQTILLILYNDYPYVITDFCSVEKIRQMLMKSQPPRPLGRTIKLP